MRRVAGVLALVAVVLVSSVTPAAALSMDVDYVSVGSFGPPGDRFRSIDFLLHGTADTSDSTGYLECDDASYVISLHQRSRSVFSRGPLRDDPSASAGPGAQLPSSVAEGDYVAKLTCEVTPAYRAELGVVVRRCVRVTVPALGAASFEATSPPTVACPIDFSSLLTDLVFQLRINFSDLWLRTIFIVTPTTTTTTTRPAQSTPPTTVPATTTTTKPCTIYNEDKMQLEPCPPPKP
jgi:hypothetical protein